MEAAPRHTGRSRRLDLLDWSDTIPSHHWSLYRPVLEAARQRGVLFAVGGGLAYSAYAHRWRNTKDMDLYVLPEHRHALIDLVRQAGFEDYHSRQAYARHWIFRGHREGVIVDVIWQMANRRASVDELWLTRGETLEVHGLRVPLLPVEELLWAKLYVIQRDRCDWPDLLNLVQAQGHDMDWEYLLGRIGDDYRVLGGVLSLFAWMCPSQAQTLPGWIWGRLGLQDPAGALDCREDPHRINLLDTRDWFGAKL